MTSRRYRRRGAAARNPVNGLAGRNRATVNRRPITGPGRRDLLRTSDRTPCRARPPPPSSAYHCVIKSGA
eukprot:190664-Hanusia_phi.AAC.1